MVEFDMRVGFGEGDIGRIAFAYVADEGDEYDFSVSRLIPIDGRWDQTVASTLLQDDYVGLNSMSAEDLRTQLGGGVDVIEPEEDDNGFVEGYVEHESALKMQRGFRCVQALKSVKLNILTDTLEEMDSRPAVHLALVGEENTNDLELLYRYGEVMLDASSQEAILSLPTPADLITYTNAFVCAGFLAPRTTAYRGAPSYSSLVLPNPYV
jgi:hypothetical protein